MLIVVELVACGLLSLISVVWISLEVVSYVGLQKR